MNSLLKRQIRKYLNKDLANSKELEAFISAVNHSYNNFDEQFIMLQRAMTISSDELFKANQSLQKKTEAQKKVISKLNSAFETLKSKKQSNEKEIDLKDLDGLKLAEFINEQAQKVVEVNQQREKLLEELSYQNQELNDYAHMISHDLKTPLRSIDTLIVWLYDDNQKVFNQSDRETIYQIRNNVEKMELLINGILEYSTIGKSQAGKYNVDVNYAINEILGRLNIPSNITIVKKEEFPLIKADMYRIQQVFQNLISNAINFNDKKKGLVEIGFENLDNYWQFYVKDNGQGIEPQYFDKIFKTFQKLENKVGSIGMGLSVVKKIVNMYDGEVWVESEIGKGSTFFFTIKK